MSCNHIGPIHDCGRHRLRADMHNDIVERGTRRRRPWWLPPGEPTAGQL